MNTLMEDLPTNRFDIGQHVIRKEFAHDPNATVWEITERHNYAGRRWNYICAAPGFGSILLWEHEIVLTMRPVSTFNQPERPPAPATFMPHHAFLDSTNEPMHRTVLPLPDGATNGFQDTLDMNEQPPVRMEMERCPPERCMLPGLALIGTAAAVAAVVFALWPVTTP